MHDWYLDNDCGLIVFYLTVNMFNDQPATRIEASSLFPPMSKHSTLFKRKCLKYISSNWIDACESQSRAIKRGLGLNNSVRFDFPITQHIHTHNLPFREDLIN